MGEVKLLDMHLELACGNKDAAQFCQIIGKMMRLADDIVDGDSDDPSADMSELLFRMFVDMQINPFYLSHKEVFIATAGTDILLWDVSNEWAKSTDHKEQVFGFVYRMAVNTFITVAMICGGMSHARSMVKRMFEFNQFRDNEEQLEDWIKEHHELRKEA